jgi:hypothetical protein
MPAIEWVISGVELILDKTPIVGKLKSVLERDLPMRQLNPEEVTTDLWLAKLCQFLNSKFRSDYGRDYTPEQVRGWIKVYPSTFLVVVQRKFLTWPLKSEAIIATVKLLPLRRDYCADGSFESYDVLPEQLVTDENKAKAVWVGDLVSTNNNLLVLFMALGYKLEDIEAPVYCRTVIKQLRHILMERYGARVINPTGAEATKATILVLEPSRLRRTPSNSRKRQVAA